MNGELRLKIDLEDAPHEFTVMHPFDDIELSHSVVFCDSYVIDSEVISSFPYNSRLFIDGNEVGRLVDVFEEIRDV